MFALLIACAANPPGVDLVDPSGGKPGDRVRVVGNDFQQGASATLGGEAAELSYKGVISLELTVPELTPGEHELVVTNPDGQTATVPRAFAVAPPPEALSICSGAYTAYSQLAASRKIIKIDRHPTGDGERETLQIDFSDIAAVEYEARVQGDDYCSAIILRLKDGRREVYEDSKDLVFRTKAQELANVLGTPVDVTHEDPREVD
ncbi:MAG TPA: hypothetical protein QGF58_18295 [Myxococcota bacterium]|nr:hypothetical protein [Myxococcota bacterium]